MNISLQGNTNMSFNNLIKIVFLYFIVIIAFPERSQARHLRRKKDYTDTDFSIMTRYFLYVQDCKIFEKEGKIEGIIHSFSDEEIMKRLCDYILPIYSILEENEVRF